MLHCGRLSVDTLSRAALVSPCMLLPGAAPSDAEVTNRPQEGASAYVEETRKNATSRAPGVVETRRDMSFWAGITPNGQFPPSNSQPVLCLWLGAATNLTVSESRPLCTRMFKVSLFWLNTASIITSYLPCVCHMKGGLVSLLEPGCSAPRPRDACWSLLPD